MEAVDGGGEGGGEAVVAGGVVGPAVVAVEVGGAGLAEMGEVTDGCRVFGQLFM